MGLGVGQCEQTINMLQVRCGWRNQGHQPEPAFTLRGDEQPRQYCRFTAQQIPCF